MFSFLMATSNIIVSLYLDQDGQTNTTAMADEAVNGKIKVKGRKPIRPEFRHMSLAVLKATRAPDPGELESLKEEIQHALRGQQPVMHVGRAVAPTFGHAGNAVLLEANAREQHYFEGLHNRVVDAAKRWSHAHENLIADVAQGFTPHVSLFAGTAAYPISDQDMEGMIENINKYIGTTRPQDHRAPFDMNRLELLVR